MSIAKVLIADDSVTIQKVFELAFENEDVDVMVAGDGFTAFDMAIKTMPDVVIADVNMPDMSGFTLCEKIKSNPDTSHIPVYLLASALDDFDDIRAQKSGAAGKFEKPFRSEDMVMKVKTAIDNAEKRPSTTMIVSVDEPPFARKKAASEPDDTFDEIDVSLDNIMDSLELPEDEDLPEFPDDDIFPPELISMTGETTGVNYSTPQILDLGSDSIADTANDMEDDIEVEVFSGDEESTGEENDEEISEEEIEAITKRALGEEIPDLSKMDRDSAKKILDEAFGAPEGEYPPLEAVSVQSMAQPASADDDEMYTDALKILKSIEDDEEVDEFSVDETAAALVDLEPEPEEMPETFMEERVPEGRPAGGQFDHMIEEAVNKAVGKSLAGNRGLDTAIVAEAAAERFSEDLRSGHLNAVITQSIKEAVEQVITPERIEAVLTQAMRAAIQDLSPKIMETFNKVATEVTLGAAEDLVRQTIEQIKAGS